MVWEGEEGRQFRSLDLQLSFLGGWSFPMQSMTPLPDLVPSLWPPRLPRGLVGSSPRGMGLPAPQAFCPIHLPPFNSSCALLTLTPPSASASSLVPDYAFSLFLSGFPW